MERRGIYHCFGQAFFDLTGMLWGVQPPPLHHPFCFFCDNFFVPALHPLTLIVLERYPCPMTERLKVDGAMNSLGVFLGQEAVRFNGLVAVMRSTLSELQKAIRYAVFGDTKEVWMESMVFAHSTHERCAGTYVL